LYLLDKQCSEEVRPTVIVIPVHDSLGLKAKQFDSWSPSEPDSSPSSFNFGEEKISWRLMSTRYFFTPDSVCSSGIGVPFSSISSVGENRMAGVGVRNRTSRSTPASFLIRMAMRISRARWFSFLRRVFHYQNGSRSELGSNPFNSGSWMAMEFVALVVQILVTTYTLAVSREERPIWPMRVWISGYDFGCIVNLVILYWRYLLFHTTQGDGFGLSDVEQQRNTEESRSLHFMNKCRTFVELFFAIWFVMGNVWVFDSRFGSFRRAPKLHLLCISLLAWNAISYSFPFILFVLLCCCVPLISNLLGYNMNVGSVDRGASDEQLSDLPSWKFKEAGSDLELGKSVLQNENTVSADLVLLSGMLHMFGEVQRQGRDQTVAMFTYIPSEVCGSVAQNYIMLSSLLVSQHCFVELEAEAFEQNLTFDHGVSL
ncbi:hypothetical protein RJ640_004892, partial [Escallonia rubra]